MFPIILLITSTLLGIGIGGAISGGIIKDLFIRLLKLPKIVHVSVIILAPIIYAIVFYLKSKFSFWEFSSMFVIVSILGYLFGISIEMKKGIKTYLKQSLSFIFLMLIILLPFFSSCIGKSFSKIYINPTSIILQENNFLGKVKIYADAQIEGLSFFQTDNYIYEGLRILTFKNEVYYFVADYFQLDKFKDKIDKVSKELDEINIENSLVLKQLVSEQDTIKKLLKNTDFTKLDSELSKLQELNDPDLERKRKLEIIKRKLEIVKSKIRIISEVLKETETKSASADRLFEKSKQLMNESNKKLEEFKNLSAYFSEMFSKTFIIRKELIKNIEIINAKL